MPAQHASGTLGGLASSELDRDSLVAAGTYGWLVQSGAVTFSSGLTFNVAAVAAGDYVVNGTSGAAYAGGTVTLSAQDATNPRVDIIVITSAGAVSAVAGTPRGAGTLYAASTSAGSPTSSFATSGPVPTAPSASQLEIARIYVPASGTSLSAASITDRRLNLIPALAAQPYLSPPWYMYMGVPGSQTMVANTAYLIPMNPLTAAVTLSAISYRLTVQSGNVDWGIYSTTDYSTFTKVASTGSTTCPASANPNVTSLSASLKTGVQYFFALAFDNAVASIYAPVTSGYVPAILGYKKATSFPLPSSLTGMTATANASDTFLALGRHTTGMPV